MDCIVHGVAKNRTRLSNFHFHFGVGLSACACLVDRHGCAGESCEPVFGLGVGACTPPGTLPW